MIEAIAVSCMLFGAVLVIMGAVRQSAPTVLCGILLLCGLTFLGEYLPFAIVFAIITGLGALGLACRWGLIKDLPHEEEEE